MTCRRQKTGCKDECLTAGSGSAIMTINAKTGEPVTTAMMEEGLDVYVIAADKKNLKLSATMYDPELLRQTEEVVGQDLVSYL